MLNEAGGMSEGAWPMHLAHDNWLQRTGRCAAHH